MAALRTRIYDAISTLVVWHHRRLGMHIGVGCKIARSAKLDRTNPKGVWIGDYTAIAFDASILAHDFIRGEHRSVEIGSCCFIGARSMIMPGVKVGNNSIVGTGSVVLTDVPPNSVVSGNPARLVETNIVTGKWGIRDPKFLKEEGIEVAKLAPAANQSLISDAPLASYFPHCRDTESDFETLGIDSFSLIALRAEIEENEGIQIEDAEWMAVRSPSDVARFITKAKSNERRAKQVGATATRRLEINMPQMAMGGLSEPWLFKEVGDIHWSILTSSLGVNSRNIADQAGDRLYATFTRIRYKSHLPFADFQENDELKFTAAMTRFGASLFFSSIEGKTSGGTIDFEVMSSFSKFQEAGDNRSLIKGQPCIPDDFAIPSVGSLPDFAKEYRVLRASEPAASIFSTEYHLIPNHDINGVGLLYFAAYPSIADICLARYLASSWSPIERDICYFANSGPQDTIRYDLVGLVEHGADAATATATLTRVDGKRMALITTKLLKR